jgi:hypothetical protein
MLITVFVVVVWVLWISTLLRFAVQRPCWRCRGHCQRVFWSDMLLHRDRGIRPPSLETFPLIK